MIDYDDYQKELFWEFQKLGLDKDNPSIRRFVSKVYDDGYWEGYSEGYDVGNWDGREGYS